MSDMRLERLKALIDAYGAHPARWPEAERAAALALVDAYPQAQDWLAEARVLDDLMDAVSLNDHAHVEADQPAFERAVERFAADFTPHSNVVTFPVLPARRPSASRSVVWGAGIALAACLAGAIFGVNLSLVSLSDVRVTSVLEQVAMIDGGN